MKYKKAFYSQDRYLLNKKIEEEVKKHVKDPDEGFSFFSYDFAENTFDDLLEQLGTQSFFTDKKVIVIHGLESIKKIDDKFLKHFIKYLENDDTNTFLLAKLEKKPSKSDGILFEIIEKYFKLDYVQIKDDNLYLEENLQKLVENGYQITKDNLIFLFSRVMKNYGRFETEIKKLCLYKSDVKKIEQEDIILSVSDEIDDNIFLLTNNLFSDNKKEIIQYYNNLLVKNLKETQIIQMIYKRLSQLYKAKQLLKKRLLKDDIAKHLAITPGQAYYLLKDCQNIKEDIIYNMILDIANCDYMIKSGRIDPKVALETFLIKREKR